MPEKDYYSILGVSETAGEAEIKKAFRGLAKKFHPDATKGDKDAERRFKEMTEAYDVLSDKEKRAQYDQLRHARETGFGPGGFDFSSFRRPGQGRPGQGGPRPGPGRPGAGPEDYTFTGPGGEGYSFEDLGDFGDLFSSIFGREARFSNAAGRQYRPQKGEDLVMSLEVPFETAVHGGKMTVSLPRTEVCPRCGGAGAEPGTKPTTCPTCGGRGMVSSNQGGFAISRPCPQCLGRGTINPKPCTRCGGSGHVEERKSVTVNIPRGVQDGAKIRLAGLGEVGVAGGPPGDMYLLVHVLPHAEFQRRGNDIHTTISIDMAEAALGKRVPVKTLQGEVTLNIPPGTQPGAKMRLRGRGVTGADGSQGDHYVTVNVRVPKDLSPRRRQILEEFAKTT